jgi:hypothetical protein
MTDKHSLTAKLLLSGRIDEAAVVLLRKEVLAGGNTGRKEVEFLLDLRHQAHWVCPAFEQLFFEALKRNVLIDGTISDENALWLREVLLADGVIDSREKDFLDDLHWQAVRVGREFRRLHAECVSSEFWISE